MGQHAVEEPLTTMTTTYMKSSDPAVSALVSRTFPGTNFQTVTVRVYTQGGMALTSYWSGGTREYHRIIRLEDMTALDVPENGSGFTQVDRAYGPSGLPLELPAPGFAVVTHTHGGGAGIAISIHTENAAKLLPAPVEMTWAERVVLTATRSLKSSYAGIKDFRFYQANDETGINRAEWDAAKASLITRKMLNAAGAITVDGRNAAGTGSLYNLKRVATVEAN